MSRVRPFLLLALLAFAFLLTSAPSHAQPAPISFIRCGINGAGVGETIAEAVAKALEVLRDDYFITSYVVTDSSCTDIDFDPFDPDNPTEPLCFVEIRACGIPRPFFPHFP